MKGLLTILQIGSFIALLLGSLITVAPRGQKALATFHTLMTIAFAAATLGRIWLGLRDRKVKK